MRQLRWYLQNRLPRTRKFIRELRCAHRYVDQPHLGWGIMRCVLCHNTGYYGDAEKWQRARYGNVKPPVPVPPKEGTSAERTQPEG